MNGSDDFDWHGESVVLRCQPAVAVYENPHGEIVIRQEGHYGPEEDQWLYITRYNAPKVAKAILALVGIELSLKADGEISPPRTARKGATAAERQRRYRERQRNEESDGECHGERDETVTPRDCELPLRLIAAE
jgi:hypothetical protein